MPERAASTLIIRLFGPFELLVNGCPPPRLRTRKGEWLLALLAMRAGGELDRAWLASTLWPDSSPSQAFVNLRVSLNDLRRVLGAADSQPGARDRLGSPTGRTLRLDLTGAEVDVVAFDEGIACGDAAALERVVALYRGPLLEECAEEWVFLERRSREQAYLQALETLAAHALERGEPAAAERHLRRATEVDPLRESAQRALMQALAEGGNYAAATQVYRELRLLLHRELNGEPDPETTALYERIRAEVREKAAASARLPARGESASSRSPSRTPGAARREIVEGTVTFLLTDIEGSTRLWLQHPDAMRLALARHDELLTASIEHHGGTVLKQHGEGDSCFAVFSRATDAVAAAVALQRALALEPWPAEAGLHVRVALHTGEAELREGDYYGPAVNHCARLRAVGHGGQTLLSQTTAALVRDELPEGVSLRDLGSHRLKDLQRPEPIFQLLHPALPADFPPLRGLDTAPNNLPVQRTLLIGREEAVTTARQLLLREDAGLVTLTGPGGTGKTRLALQVAADLIDVFTDGVFFVDLAPIRDPGLVASTIAQTLGVRETGGQPLLETLKSFLRAKSFLLVLDNFEQVLEAGPTVAELLAAAPRLKVLVTSRAALRLRGEKEFAVLPLALPPVGVPLVGALPSRAGQPQGVPLQQYAAVGLFVQRALDVKPDFVITRENAPVVAEICHRLDGLPLALELAAARVKLFSPEALLSRLENRLTLLTGGARDLPARQQTLRDTIGWSYDLLSEREKALFRRLSVFVGGCTLEAVESTGSAEENLQIDVLDGVASLVDKNLLRPGGEVAGTPRFTMLETVREYGRECLERHGEAAAATERHAHFYLRLVEDFKRTARGCGNVHQEEWFDQLQAEYGNIRAALAWSCAAPALESEAVRREVGLRLAAALREFWIVRGLFSDARHWLERLLAQPSEGAPTAAWAGVLLAAGSFAYFRGDYNSARAHLTQSLSVAREVWEPELVVWSLLYLGNLLRGEGDIVGARGMFEESLVVAQETGNAVDLAWSLNCLGFVASEQGDYTAACSYLERSLALYREIGQNSGIAWSLLNLADTTRRLKDHTRAAMLYRESLTCFEKTGSQRNLAFGLEGLAWLFSEEGQPRRAAQLLGAGERLREASGCPIAPADRGDYDGHVAAVRTALGEEAFAAAWAEGRAMTLEDAVAVARDERGCGTSPPLSYAK